MKDEPNEKSNERSNDKFVEKLTTFGADCKKLNFNFSINIKHKNDKWLTNLSIYNQSGDKIDKFENSTDLYDSIVKLFE